MLGYLTQKTLQSMFETVRVPGHGLIVKTANKGVYNHLSRLNTDRKCKCSVLLYGPITNAQKEIARGEKMGFDYGQDE